MMKSRRNKSGREPERPRVYRPRTEWELAVAEATVGKGWVPMEEIIEVAMRTIPDDVAYREFQRLVRRAERLKIVPSESAMEKVRRELSPETDPAELYRFAQVETLLERKRERLGLSLPRR